jgi:hypothetical protein
MEITLCRLNFLFDFLFIKYLFKGYLPAKVERREDTLIRKRDEYWSYVSQYYHTRTESEHQDTFRQVFEPFENKTRSIFRLN